MITALKYLYPMHCTASSCNEHSLAVLDDAFVRSLCIFYLIFFSKLYNNVLSFRVVVVIVTP